MRKYESDVKPDGTWRTVSGRRIFIRNGESLTEAMRKSGKFGKADVENAKQRVYGDGQEPSEKFLKDYTEGEFANAYIVAQKLIEGKEINDSAFVTGNGMDHAKETRRLLDKINSSTPSDQTLVRYENGSINPIPKEGDTWTVGLRSFSRDKDFVNKVVANEDKGVKAFGGNIVEYITEGKTRSFDMAPYSNFKQQEALVSGDFKVKNVEKVATQYVDKKGRTLVFDKTVVHIEQI